MNLLIGSAVYLFILACFVVFAWMLIVWLGIITEKALDTTDQLKQARKQEAERAQEPQNVLLRAGMIGDVQPQTLVRPAMAEEETAPQTLLRPSTTNRNK